MLSKLNKLSNSQNQESRLIYDGIPHPITEDFIATLSDRTNENNSSDNSPESNEIETPDNYFAAVNQAFDESIDSGNFRNNETMDQIIEEHGSREGFFSKALSFLQHPIEGFRWMRNRVAVAIVGRHIEEYSRARGILQTAQDRVGGILDETGEVFDNDPETDEENPSENESDNSETNEIPEGYITLEEAIENTKEETRILYTHVENFVTNHRELIFVCGAALTSFGSLTGAGRALGSMSALAYNSARLPFRFGPIPAAAFFGSLGFVYHFLEENQDDLLVPESPQALKEMILDRMRNSESWIAQQDLSPDFLNQENISNSLDYILGIKPIEELYAGINSAASLSDVVIGGAITQGIDFVGLSPQENILRRNLDGISIFHNTIDQINHENENQEYQELLNEITEFETGLSNHDTYTSDQLNQLIEIAARVDIDIFEHNGYIMWQIIDENGVVTEDNGPFNLLISNEVSPERAGRLANNWISNNPDSGDPTIALSSAIRRVRTNFGEIFSDIENDEDFSGKLSDLIQNHGWTILKTGGLVTLENIAEGLSLNLGPWNILSTIIDDVIEDGEFHAANVLATYGSGLVPVLVFGTAANVTRRLAGGVGDSSLRFLWNTLGYPIRGTANFIHFARQPLEFTNNRRQYYSASGEATLNGLRHRWDGIRGNSSSFAASRRTRLRDISNIRREFYQLKFHHEIGSGRHLFADPVGRLNESIRRSHSLNDVFSNRSLTASILENNDFENLLNETHRRLQSATTPADINFRTNPVLPSRSHAPGSPARPHIQTPSRAQLNAAGEIPSSIGRGGVGTRHALGAAAVIGTTILAPTIAERLRGEDNVVDISSNSTQSSSRETYSDDAEPEPEPSATNNNNQTLLNPADISLNPLASSIALVNHNRYGMTQAELESYLSERRSSRDLEEETQFNTNIMNLNSEIIEIGRPYDAVSQLMNPRRIAEIDDNSQNEDEFGDYVDDLAYTHEQQIQRATTLIENNYEILEELFRRKTNEGEINPELAISPYLHIKYDTEDQEIILKYDSTRHFTRNLWDNYDQIRFMQSADRLAQRIADLGPDASPMQESYDLQDEWYERLSEAYTRLANQEITQEEYNQIALDLQNTLGPQIEDTQRNIQTLYLSTIGPTSVAPIAGSIYDLHQTRNNIERGDFGRAIGDAGMFTLGTLGDVFSYGTIGSGARGAASASEATRIGESVQASLRGYRHVRQILQESRMIRMIDILDISSTALDLGVGILQRPTLNKETVIHRP